MVLRADRIADASVNEVEVDVTGVAQTAMDVSEISYGVLKELSDTLHE
jgi:hypothetical protein